MSSSIVSPTPGIRTPSPLYATEIHSKHIIAATPQGLETRCQQARLFQQAINSQSQNQSTDHTVTATFDYGSFPLLQNPAQSIHSTITDLDASSLLQQITSSLSNLDAEQKHHGKENGVPEHTIVKSISELDESIVEQMRFNEHEGKDELSQANNRKLFSQHEPALVVRKLYQAACEEQNDTSRKHVRVVDIEQHQAQAEARDSLLNSLMNEQHEEMNVLSALQFPSPPEITLPQPTALPATPPPLSQPAVDDSLMRRERPAVPKRFVVADAELMTTNRTNDSSTDVDAAGASLFASALELSVLARTVPDLPDLPDYSDIALPALPDVPNVPEPLPEELPGHDRPKSRASSVASSREDQSGTPAYLNAMPANVVAGQQSSQFGIAAPPRPNRPGRLSQGPIMPSAQKLNIHAPPPRNSIHSPPPMSQAQQAQNAALNAVLRTTLGDITDEQLEEVVSNK